MMLPPVFREFIALMISACVRLVMIGGYAYNIYRAPRATGDIDFLVAFDSANERLLRKVLADLDSVPHFLMNPSRFFNAIKF
jgi:predicted nucleotidyltransferase